MEGSTESLENRMDAVEQRVECLEVTTAKVLERLDAMRATLKDLGHQKLKPTPIEEQREEDGWNENIEEDLKFWKLEARVIVEPEIENAENREGGSIHESVSAIAKPEKGDDGDAKQLPGQSPSKWANDDTDVAEALSLNALGEISFSCVTDLGDREKKEEKSRRSDEIIETFGDDKYWGRSPDYNDWGRPPEEKVGGATTDGVGDAEETTLEVEEEHRGKDDEAPEERRSDSREPPLETAERAVTVVEAVAAVQLFHIVRVQRFHNSLSVEMRKLEEWENKNWAELDSSSISLGQAQVTVSKSVHTLIFTPTQFIINVEMLQVKREVDLVANSLGQTHNFIITPPIFTNTERTLQVVDGLTNQRDKLFNISPLVSKILDWPMIVKKGEWSLNIVPSFIDMKVTRREATILYDSTGCFSSSFIIWSSCFKLWDPGGRPLMGCFQCLHLEDKVHV